MGLFGVGTESALGGGGTPLRGPYVLDAADLVEEGGRLLYTPAAGEVVTAVLFTDVVFDASVGSQWIAVGDETSQSEGEGRGMGFIDSDLLRDSVGLAVDAVAVIDGDSPIGSMAAIRITDQPIYARFGSGSVKIDSAPGVWQANHVYTGGEWIIAHNEDSDTDELYQASAGTSGGSAPTFNNGPVTDNTVTWTDFFAPPTAGGGTCYLRVETASL